MSLYLQYYQFPQMNGQNNEYMFSNTQPLINQTQQQFYPNIYEDDYQFNLNNDFNKEYPYIPQYNEDVQSVQQAPRKELITQEDGSTEIKSSSSKTLNTLVKDEPVDINPLSTISRQCSTQSSLQNTTVDTDKDDLEFDLVLPSNADLNLVVDNIINNNLNNLTCEDKNGEDQFYIRKRTRKSQNQIELLELEYIANPV